MKAILSIAIFILSASHALAESTTLPALKRYHVEIIIFEDSHARYINNQSWNQDSNTVINSADINTIVSSEEADKVDFETVKPVILKNDYKRINSSSEFNVMFYGSWIQTGLSKNNAFNIDITELKNIHKTTSKNTLSGNLKLVLARYLHLYGDLNYLRKDSNIDPVTELPASTSKTFPMEIHRRMRSKELHYIDHPLVGILVQINPVEIKVDTATVTN